MFRCVFWGFLGLMILPSLVDIPGGETTAQHVETSESTETQQKFSANDALYMAAGVAGHFKDICAHDAELCETGARLAEAAFARAKKGIMVVADMVEAHRAKMDDANDPTTTASIE